MTVQPAQVRNDFARVAHRAIGDHIADSQIALILKPLGWRISPEDEMNGIDESSHAETAYDLVSRGGRVGVSGSGPIHDARHHTESLSPEGAK